MATACDYRLTTESYVEQRGKHWPPLGRHILAQFDEKCIVVYQAFCPEIADYAVLHGKFGGPKYSFTRMTWIKTNFLWMMYRSNWAQKKNQDRILAIFITRDGFDEILRYSKGNQSGIKHETSHMPGNVRIQWDPDHDPRGENERRRAVQLGIKGRILQKFHDQFIQHIEDITEFVKEQRQHVIKKELDKLLTPAERVYTPSDKEVCKHILLDEFHDSKKEFRENNSTEGEDPNDIGHFITISKNATQADITKEDDGSKILADVLETGLQETNDSPLMKQPAEVGGAFCGELLSPLTQTTAAKGNTEENVIVCLGGAFNPVHTRHVEVLETAIQWLGHNTDYHILGGRLAVAPDGYVKSKCRKSGELCMKAEHRIKLCELTCDGHEMIKPYHKTVGSAMDCGKHVTWEENLKKTRIAVIVGADRAMSKNCGRKKWQSKNKCITLCVGRKGETDEVKKSYEEDCKRDLHPNPNFFIIDKELDNVSSTGIRRELRQASKSHNTPQSSGIGEDHLCNSERGDEPLVIDLNPEQLVKEKDNEAVKDSPINSISSEERTDNITKRIDNSAATGLNYQARTVDKESDDSLARRRVVDDLVKRGWIAESAGQYILDNFSDLYL